MFEMLTAGVLAASPSQPTQPAAAAAAAAAVSAAANLMGAMQCAASL
jgi:hypothetical protein